MGMTAAFNTEGKRTAPLRPSNLQFDKVILHSSTGVQQGDPLGPLLFAAGVQPLAAGLRASPVDFTSFYLDDGVLAGSVDSVATALTTPASLGHYRPFAELNQERSHCCWCDARCSPDSQVATQLAHHT